VVAFAAAALVLDVLEISQQLGADHIGMAALAAMIAALRGSDDHGQRLPVPNPAGGGVIDRRALTD
jgi:hypothetical protein